MYWTISVFCLLLLATSVTSIRYEAEDGFIAGNAGLENCNLCTCSGGKMVKRIGLSNSGQHGVLSFNVQVATAGIYEVEIGYQTTSLRDATITVNSDPATALTRSFSPSGSQWCYQGGSTSIKKVQIELQSGSNTITFDNDNNKAPIFDYIDIASNPMGGDSETSEPVKYEAEDASLNGDYRIATCSSMGCSCSGNKMVMRIGLTGSNKADMTFNNINVAQTGYYNVKIEYMTKPVRYMDIIVNNGEKNVVQFSGTGDWCYDNGATNSKYVSMYLIEGQANTIKFDNNDDKAPIIDYIEIPAETSEPPTDPSSTEFQYSSTVTGVHYMQVTYSASSDSTIKVFVNNVENDILVLPSTNSQQKKYSININLSVHGVNKIKFTVISGNPIINEINVEKRNPKKGLIPGVNVDGLEGSDDHHPVLNHFKDSVSWYYQYTPVEQESTRQWARDNNIEFVPMIGYGGVRHHITNAKCALIERKVGESKPLCTLQQIIDEIGANDMNRVKYVMGTNEPWNPNDANIAPDEAVFIWSNYIQPLREHFGIKLISPNVKVNYKGLDWMEDFLKLCVDDSVCDVNTIDVIAVHEYTCKETFYKSNYDETKSFGTFYTKLVSQMDNNYGGINWSKWVEDRPVWITETNCYWERIPNAPSNKEMCESVTLQSSNPGHGVGSLQWFDNNPKIERYAWWTSILDPTHWDQSSQLVDYDTKELNPTGLAYINPVSSTNCNN